MDYFTQPSANDGSNLNLQVGVDGRNSQASVSIPLAPPSPASAPHLSCLAENFCSPLSFSLPWWPVGAMTWGTQGRGFLGASGGRGVVCPVQWVKDLSWMAFDVARDTETHPSITSVCEEDHTRMFPFVIVAPPCPPPHVRLRIVLHPAEFLLAQSWICLHF